jgi:hypothetical protein
LKVTGIETHASLGRYRRKLHRARRCCYLACKKYRPKPTNAVAPEAGQGLHDCAIKALFSAAACSDEATD